MRSIRPTRTTALALALTAAVGLGACGGDAADTSEEAAEPEAGSQPSMTSSQDASLPELLESGEVVFGLFSGEQNEAGGRAIAEMEETDFVFYSLESGPFDMEAMSAYIDGMNAASQEMGTEPHPVILRIPPIHLDTAQAREHVRMGLENGAAGLVYPHVIDAEEAALSSELLGDRLWPTNPDGDLINVVLIEDQEGIGNAQAIVGTPGVSVAIPGPGDLRRAYEGDMEAVEEAIQTVLAACLELDVACGITAGVDDIAERIDQGFRFFIVTQPEAIAVGMEHAGRR